MYLSRDEEAVYQGERGETLARMMQILVALGDIYGAERLVTVKSVQIAGVSYKNIGPAGLEWISRLQGRVAVPSILNPAGMDLVRWREMGIDEAFAERQRAVVQAYERLGVCIDCTCTPYQIYDSLAGRGDHLAWSESSAVSYANSVIGARSNREGGPSALAAALVGKTALYGYHLDENRMPTHLIDVQADLMGSDFGALGFLAGGMVKDGVPFFRLRSAPGRDDLKALGAAMAASGSVALYYVQDATAAPPGSNNLHPQEKITLGRAEIDQVYEQHPAEGCDAVAIGCPHCSGEELERVARLIGGRKVKAKMKLWICTARKVADAHPALVAAIEESGARVFCDTCMVVSPATERFSKMLTCSGKALAYLPGLAGVKAGYCSLEDCIEAALVEERQ
ncbi:MAG TPA: aconitase X catalytic domain-containing protein [Methanothrix sp.]|nr:aconitase X catalytic domain-containing protein [Methanothrix sp.]HPT19047.1 aconitase X catalytic domain-containing protein [Methanothrix sp.]